jgi:hypothetical protein
MKSINPQSILSHEVQVGCCEMTGALCSPLLSYYRHTSTILYRVQQHVRKLVPIIIHQQSNALTECREAQRGVLDATDSLQMIETLNTHVTRSLADVAARSARCAALLASRAKANRDKQTKRQLALRTDSIPSTPHGGDSNHSRHHSSSSRSDSFPTAGTPGRRLHNTTPALLVTPRITSNANSTVSSAVTLPPSSSSSSATTTTPAQRSRPFKSSMTPSVVEEELHHSLAHTHSEDDHEEQSSTKDAFVP